MSNGILSPVASPLFAHVLNVIVTMVIADNCASPSATISTVTKSQRTRLYVTAILDFPTDRTVFIKTLMTFMAIFVHIFAEIITETLQTRVTHKEASMIFKVCLFLL